MRYLLCALDDSHYTEPYYEFFFNSPLEAEQRCIEMVMEEFGYRSAYEAGTYMKIGKPEMTGNYRSYRYDYSDGESFVVNQIFEVPDMPKADYMCVWHHAYDGVSFFIDKIGTYHQCLKAKKRSFKKRRKEIFASVDFNDTFQTCIDTDNEWEVWNLVKISA